MKKTYLAITIGLLIIPIMSYAVNLAEDIYTAPIINVKKTLLVPVLTEDKTSKNLSAFYDHVYGVICYQYKDSISCVKI